MLPRRLYWGKANLQARYYRLTEKPVDQVARLVLLALDLLSRKGERYTIEQNEAREKKCIISGTYLHVQSLLEENVENGLLVPSALLFFRGT